MKKIFCIFISVVIVFSSLNITAAGVSETVYGMIDSVNYDEKRCVIKTKDLQYSVCFEEQLYGYEIYLGDEAYFTITNGVITQIDYGNAGFDIAFLRNVHYDDYYGAVMCRLFNMTDVTAIFSSSVNINGIQYDAYSDIADALEGYEGFVYYKERKDEIIYIEYIETYEESLKKVHYLKEKKQFEQSQYNITEETQIYYFEEESGAFDNVFEDFSEMYSYDVEIVSVDGWGNARAVIITQMHPSALVEGEKSVNIGDYVQMGEYYNEPIVWRCIDVDENGPLMISDKILCFKPYDAAGIHSTDSEVGGRRKYGSNLWETSNIRCWLNSSSEVEWECGNPPDDASVNKGYNDYASEPGFLSGFSYKELEMIKKDVMQKSLLNYYDYYYENDITQKEGTGIYQYNGDIKSNSSDYETAFSNVLYDTVFLPDTKQMRTIYKNRDILGEDYYIGYPTYQACKNSEWSITYRDDKKVNYWLRTPYCGMENPSAVEYVYTGGYIAINDAYNYNIGIRPAFYLKVESVQDVDGEGTLDSPYIFKVNDDSVFEYEEFSYRIDKDGNAVIVSYNGEYNDILEIPDNINGHEVVTIEDYAFENLYYLNSLFIPGTVSFIGENIFFERCELSRVFYDGLAEQWSKININANNTALLNADIHYKDEMVDAELYCSYSEGFVNGELIFDCSMKNCLVYIHIINASTEEVEATHKISINSGTELESFTIPFTADNKMHIIKISFIDNELDFNAVGQELKQSFHAHRITYTDNEFEYAVVNNEVEVINYFGETGEVVIPDSLGGYRVTRIGDSAFVNKEITSVSIPDTVTHIGEYAFADTDITKITLPDKLTHIGSGAFAGTLISSVFIPASVVEIGMLAFDYCYSLESFCVDENNVNYCDNDDDLYSKDMKELVRYAPGKKKDSWIIPDTVAVIKSGALSDSEYLINVTIPDSVITIERYAFSYADWETITIPASVLNIDRAVFVGCRKLTEIKVDGNNMNYCDSNGVLLDKNKTTLLGYPAGLKKTFYKVSEGVRNIAQEAFEGCLIETIAFPISLETIERDAFQLCDGIESVLYAGTEKNYDEIEIEPGNNALVNADITFGYDFMPASIKSVLCWCNENSVTAKINFDYIEQEGRLYLGIYDGKKLVKSTSEPVSGLKFKNTLEITDTDENYKGYNVKVFYWENSNFIKPLTFPVETKITESVLVTDVLESQHPYMIDRDETQIYVYDGACESLTVIFSDETNVEMNYDYLYIYDADDNQIGEYTGTELAGQAITIPGNVVKIRLVSDEMIPEYGYKTDLIIVNK